MDTEEKKLKDCPFCGSEDISMEWFAIIANWKVRCNHCWANGSAGRDKFETISAWNKRPQVKRLQSAMAAMSTNMNLQALTIRGLQSNLQHYMEVWGDALWERDDARKWAKRYKKACLELMKICNYYRDTNLDLWAILFGWKSTK